MQPSPTVSWGQKKDVILLKVHLKDVKGHDISVNDGTVTFTGFGHGASGENTYKFSLNLFDKVAENPSVTVTPAVCQIILSKQKPDETWPRLTKEKVKLPWLRVDFDYLETDGDSESEGADDEADNSGDPTVRNLEKMLKNPKQLKDELTGDMINYMKKAYLFTYNIFQWSLFSLIMLNLVITVGVEHISEAFYVQTDSMMRLAQIVMFLEIVNAAMKLTKSSVIPTIMQVGGRAIFIFVIIPNEPRLQSSFVVLGLFFTYTSVEMIRYPYYMLQSLDKDWYPLMWLRYTVWIILYPIGFVLEAVVLYLFISHRAETMFETQIASLAPFISIPIILMMCIADYTMLRYMWRQRVKKIGGGVARIRRGPPRKAKAT